MCGGFQKCLDLALRSKKKLVVKTCSKCAFPILDKNSKGLLTCDGCGSCVERVPGE